MAAVNALRRLERGRRFLVEDDGVSDFRLDEHSIALRAASVNRRERSMRKTAGKRKKKKFKDK